MAGLAGTGAGSHTAVKVHTAAAGDETALQHRRLAVIGAGWAGLAAAVVAVQRGAHVTVFEAARVPGGRARNVVHRTAAGQSFTLDNGQHILIGAYSASLALMRIVGVEPDEALLRTPLDLRDAAGKGLHIPNWPWYAHRLASVAGILKIGHWPWRDRWALLMRLFAWQRAQFSCEPSLSVAQLCKGLAPQVVKEFIEPLCTAALNTPIATASGQVFLRILQDSVAGGVGSADLLLPKCPLGDLLAEPACQWLQSHGAEIRLGARVAQLQPLGKVSEAVADLQNHDDSQGWLVDGETFDAVVLAVPVWEAARLLGALARPKQATSPPSPSDCDHADGPFRDDDELAADQAQLVRWLDVAGAMQHEPIATVYVQATEAVASVAAVGKSALPNPSASSNTLGEENSPLLPHPMVASVTGSAQFFFDRQQLTQDHGVLACVASTPSLAREALEQDVLRQLQQDVLRPSGAQGHWQVLATIVEKRATFACTVDLRRPSAHPHAAWRHLVVAGDYVEGPYPATLEGAVRSGQQAVDWLTQSS